MIFLWREVANGNSWLAFNQFVTEKTNESKVKTINISSIFQEDNIHTEMFYKWPWGD